MLYQLKYMLSRRMYNQKMKKKFLIGSLLGASLGWAAAWFFSPKTGNQNREDFGKMLKKRSQQVQDGFDYVTRQGQKLGQRTAEITNSAVRSAGEAVEGATHSLADNLHNIANNARSTRERMVNEPLQNVTENNNSEKPTRTLTNTSNSK